MLIPDEYQVDPKQRRLVLKAMDVAEPELDLELPQRALRRRLDELGVEHLDLLPVFVEQGRRLRLYRPQDTHWNRAGNSLAAHQLAARLNGDDSPRKGDDS
jgi:hypothetical protein